MQTTSSNGSSQPENPHIQKLEQDEQGIAHGVLARTAVLIIGIVFLLEHAEQTRFIKCEWIVQNFLWFFPLIVLVVSYLIYKGFVADYVERRSKFGWAVLSFFTLTAPILLLCFCFSGFTALGYSTWIFTYDPINAATIVSLVLLTPISNICLLPVLLKDRIENPIAAGLMNGLALGTSLVFGVLFSPIVAMMLASLGRPLYLGGLLEAFMGLLVLAMMLSPYSVCILSCLQCKSIWKLRDTAKGMQASMFACLGLVLSLLLLLCPGVSTVVTNVATVKAATQAPDASTAVRFLRAFESTDDLMRKAYFQNVPKLELAPAILACVIHEPGVLSPPTPELARKAIYRITGKNFNSFKKPSVTPLPGWWWAPRDEDRGGSEVGGLSPDLTMMSSEMNCFCYKDALASRVDWTLKFSNSNPTRDAEARMLILLPPNAVASGLRLFVDGKPRDAIFGSRGVVRTAYSNIVRERRDPALLSWAGNDLVLLQCFPVRNDTPMKVTLQIAAPLAMTGEERAQIMLPKVVESNCAVSAHSVRYRVENHGQTEGGFDKKIANDQIGDPIATVDGVGKQSLVCDLIGSGMLKQKVCRFQNLHKDLLLVIDCGVNTQDKIDSLGDAIANLPDSVRVGVLYATDEFADEKPLRANNNAELGRMVRYNHPRCLGGPDNLPALARAITEMKRDPSLSVIWVHGPQPVVFAENGVLDLTFSENQKSSQPLYEIEMNPGPNKVSEYVATTLFDTKRSVRLLRGTGSFEKSIPDVLLKFAGQTPTFSIVRNHTGNFAALEQKSSTFPPTPEANAQLTACALWANEKANEAYANSKIGDAADLSKKYRVVTRASSAVVLENDSQYTQAGLDAAQSDPYSSEPVESVASPTNAITNQLNSMSYAASCAGTPSYGGYSSSSAAYAGAPQNSSSTGYKSKEGEQIFAIFLWGLAALLGVGMILSFCKKGGRVDPDPVK